MNWLDLLANVEHGLERNEPMYARITAGIRKAILSGQLADNSRLPTNRELANLLKIDRSTVSRAYLELSQSGFIDSHVGRGTFVRPLAQRSAPRPTESNIEALSDSALNWSDKFSESSRTSLDLISRQPAGTNQHDMISFAGGIPTEEFYPNDQFQRIVSQLLKSEHAAEMFGYSAADGSPYLRAQVKSHLQSHGIECGDDELLIVSGSQQGIDLVTNVLVDPGDLVVLEDPSYFWAICNFRARQARCLPVSMDDDGIRLDLLESYLSRQKAKLLYVMPSFQNPTGATMSLPRRMALLELAKKYQVPILEDNFVGDLVYRDTPLPPLRSLPGGKDVVIHQGTFSKALCPGLRLGWLVAPPEVTARLLLAKRTSDLSTNSIAQIILAKYLEEGLYSKHLEHVRLCYRNRRDAMLTALSRHLSGRFSEFTDGDSTKFGDRTRFDSDVKSGDGTKLTWSNPDGGLFIWAKLPKGLSAREFLTFAEMQGVSFSPGDMFFLNGGHSEYFRLCFIQTEESIIEEGIQRLARAMRSYLQTVARSSLSELSGGARVRNNVLI
ncbi:MAG: PLP-dependent aminotransferase family protein [Cyanobacteria bacterium SZAS-4]|nr:PLP-dependent aminotransferase family protein [Cyanobacteria bacterium SZAS-4]